MRSRNPHRLQDCVGMVGSWTQPSHKWCAFSQVACRCVLLHDSFHHLPMQHRLYSWAVGCIRGCAARMPHQVQRRLT